MEVGIFNQLVGAQRLQLMPDFASHQEAYSSQQLQLALGDLAQAQEPVEVIHGQGKDFGLALLSLADLQHPM